jgi:hypothetical protein
MWGKTGKLAEDAFGMKAHARWFVPLRTWLAARRCNSDEQQAKFVEALSRTIALRRTSKAMRTAIEKADAVVQVRAGIPVPSPCLYKYDMHRTG